MGKQIRLDRIDREILFQLRRNGRLSNVELAQRIGLTPPPCLRRVKRLEDAGVIAGYRAVVDPAAVGRGLEVFVDVDINANDRKTVEAFEATAAGYDEVVELRRMFGHPDYFLQQDRVAVAGDFHHVLPRVRMRSSHERDEYLIQQSARPWVT